MVREFDLLSPRIWICRSRECGEKSLHRSRNRPLEAVDCETRREQGSAAVDHPNCWWLDMYALSASDYSSIDVYLNVQTPIKGNIA
jgi:hypothetical protein